jgi:hypothetical protein
MKTKGWGPWRKLWFSFCSMHQEYQETCHICNAGHWVNNWRYKFEDFIYKNFPKLWKWWMLEDE